MTDDPIRGAFDLLDGRTTPSRAFADDLFDRLLEETKLRPSRRPIRPQRPRLRPELRRILTIAAVIALSVAVFAVTIGPFRNLTGHAPASGGPFDASTPFRAIVEGHVVDPGPVNGTIYYDEGSGDFRLELDYWSPDSWRLVALGGSMLQSPLTNENVVAPGDFVLRDGPKLYEYSTTDHTYSEIHASEGFSPLNLLGFTDPSSAWPEACAGAETLPDEQVAGRTAHHVRCPTSGSYGDQVDLWVDGETGLILKIESHLPDTGPELPTPVAGPFKFQPGETIELSQLEYDPAFADGTFTFTPPPGSQSYSEVAPPPTTLKLGDPAPTWTAPLLDGGTLDLSSLRGKATALYFWATWCDPCVTGQPLDAFDAAAATLGGKLNLVAMVTQDDPAMYTAYVADHGYTVPVATDDDGSILRGLELSGIPALVLLDAEGNLAGIYAGDLSGNDVTSILEAFAAGDPLPDVGGTTGELIP